MRNSHRKRRAGPRAHEAPVVYPSARRRRAGWLAGLCVTLLVAGIGAAPPATAQSADQAPLVQSITGGAGYSEFTRGHGDAYHLFASYSVERPLDWRWRFDVGTQSRFDEGSFDVGAAFTKYLWGETTLTLGAGTGTGDYIAPKYRLDASLAQPIGIALLRLGYTREQSKDEKYRDGFAVGLERWFPHWILSAHWRYDIGHPGDTISRALGFGLTYFTWETFSIGVSAEFGEVSYMQVGPSNFLVNYDSESYQLGISHWLTPDSGLNFRLDYAETDFYDVTGLELSFFKRW